MKHTRKEVEEKIKKLKEWKNAIRSSGKASGVPCGFPHSSRKGKRGYNRSRDRRELRSHIDDARPEFPYLKI